MANDSWEMDIAAKRQQITLALGGILLVLLVLALALCIHTFCCRCTKGKGGRSESAVVVLVVAAAVGLLTLSLPHTLDKHLNTVNSAWIANDSPSPEAKDLHSSLFVADLHTDSLMWPRDHLTRLQYGHVDVPRLIEGNIAIQAFTIVTSTPSRLNFQKNKRPSVFSDPLTVKAVLEGWGMAAFRSLAARTRVQTQRLAQAAEASSGQLTLLRSQSDLKSYLQARKETPHVPRTAAFLGIEGLQALDGEFSNLQRFFDWGVRMAAVSHFFDTKLGGSSAGEEKGGLTAFGRQVVAEMDKLGMIGDVAHASERTIDDLLTRPAARPLLNSHTGISAVCPSPRNLADHHIKGIAQGGGLIGVAFFRPAQCGEDVMGSIIRSVLYVRDLVGIQHVALGSDWDGTTTVPFDATGMVHLTHGLLAAGLSAQDIRLVMGDNVKRFLLQNLPA